MARSAAMKKGQKKLIKDKQQMLNDIKSASGCVDCGYNEHVFVLQFDHVRGEKLFNVSIGCYKRGWAAIMEEVAKCEVVCANCHLVRSATRGEWVVLTQSLGNEE
jgi:hypothetical protein